MTFKHSSNVSLNTGFSVSSTRPLLMVGLSKINSILPVIFESGIEKSGRASALAVGPVEIFTQFIFVDNDLTVPDRFVDTRVG